MKILGSTPQEIISLAIVAIVFVLPWIIGCGVIIIDAIRWINRK